MLKNLKSLFIVDEPDEEKKDSSKSADNSNTTTNSGTNNKTDPTVPPPLPKTSSNVSSVAKIDSKIVEKLLQAIEKNNLDGFDYIEYKKSLKALDKMPMDEATKFRSAFATASTMGLTLESLLKTTRFYIGILDKENEQFSNVFKGQITDKVSSKKKEIVQFESIIKEKSETIKQLTNEITKHQKQIASLKVKIEESTSKINNTQNNFKESYNHLKSQFEEDLVKMHKYLK